MSSEAVGENGFKPITKTFVGEDLTTVLSIWSPDDSYEENANRALEVLGQSSRGRRRDIVRLVSRHILGPSHVKLTWPLAQLLLGNASSGEQFRDIFGVLYCSNTPLLRRAIVELLLPAVEAKSNTINVSSDEWYEWLRDRLEPCAESSLKRTREAQVSMLRKFGYVAAGAGCRPVANRPEPEVFAAAVALDFETHGWRSRGNRYVLSAEGPRSLTMTSTEYASYALTAAEDLGLLKKVHVADQIDWQLPSQNSVEMIAKEIASNVP